MQTTVGEIRAMLDRLPVLQAGDSLRAAEVTRVSQHADADGWRSWWERLTATVRGTAPRTVNRRPESVAAIRARKLAERQGQAV